MINQTHYLLLYLSHDVPCKLIHGNVQCTTDSASIVVRHKQIEFTFMSLVGFYSQMGSVTPGSEGKVRTWHTAYPYQIQNWHNSGTSMENISLPSKLECVK